MKVKLKVLNLARKSSLRVAIYYAQSKKCPDTPNPKDLQGCQRYVRISEYIGRCYWPPHSVQLTCVLTR
jgi:hypothetical protein